MADRDLQNGHARGKGPTNARPPPYTSVREDEQAAWSREEQQVGEVSFFLVSGSSAWGRMGCGDIGVSNGTIFDTDFNQIDDDARAGSDADLYIWDPAYDRRAGGSDGTGNR